MIYSSSYIWAEYKYNNPYKYVISQIIFLIIGLFLMKIFNKIDYNIYKRKANTFLGICFLLLILVLIPGIGSVRNGSRSWFGLFGLGFQPSDENQVAYIMSQNVPYLGDYSRHPKQEAIWAVLNQNNP